VCLLACAGYKRRQVAHGHLTKPQRLPPVCLYVCLPVSVCVCVCLCVLTRILTARTSGFLLFIFIHRNGRKKYNNIKSNKEARKLN